MYYYFSSPGLSWDVMLKMTGAKLEKIDSDMYFFIEKGLRRGVSYIAKRYAKANNNYMNMTMTLQNFQLDMNDLYGWAVIKYLPYGGFKWLKNVDGFDVNSIWEKSYILEVDLEYRDELHELHNLLAPEKLAVSSDMLTKYCK